MPRFVVAAALIAKVPGRANDDARARRVESGIVVALLMATLFLRLLCAWHYRIDSDEPQHLHVAWGWAHGLVQYRDVFDNHAPLFHILCAPLVRMLGERPDIVLLMRLAMFPLFVVSVAAVHAIARALYSERVAAWASVLAALAPGFFLVSVEFRADDLWAALWLVAIAVLVSGRLTRRRCFVVGLLLGATLGVSLKTTLLLASLCIASLASLALTRPRSWSSWRLHGARVGAGFLGLVVVPATIVAAFAWRGALEPLLYGTISHNTLSGLGLWHKEPGRIMLLPLSVVPLWVSASWLARGAATPALAARRVLVFLSSTVFFVLLLGAWPLITREDAIPVSPLVALFATPVVLSLSTYGARLPRGGVLRRWSLAAPLLATAIEIGMLLPAATPLDDNASAFTEFVASVLRLTGPGDYVMDLKGETVFRRRPYYYVLEHITKSRLARGLLPDSIPEDLVATRTPVVVGDRTGFPPRGRTFMRENYLPVGSLRVLGRMLQRHDANSETIGFSVVVPARYTIVAEHGMVRGALDGIRFEGPRFLAAGIHEFRPDAETGRFACVWATAVEHGLSPFGQEGQSS